MIREAKGVALHDLSFWSSTLPLLDGLPRVMKEYSHEYGPPVYLRLESAEGRQLHEQTLDKFAEAVSGAQLPAFPLATPADRMASSLLDLMRSKESRGRPRINEPISGFGAVIGGSCDLLWEPYVVELKVTAKRPGVRDVRQALVYAGLLNLDRGLNAEYALVANPRLGVALDFEISELLSMTGGLSLADFAAELGTFLVAAGQSG